MFERSAYGVRITEAGQLLLEYAEQMHRLATEAEGRLAALKGEIAGDLLLGAVCPRGPAEREFEHGTTMRGPTMSRRINVGRSVCEIPRSNRDLANHLESRPP